MMTIGIRELAEEAKRSGAIDLAQGIIQKDPPDSLYKALTELTPRSALYNNKRGVMELRQVLTEWLIERKWKVRLDNLMITSGAMGGIATALVNAVAPGGRVALPEPFFFGDKLLLDELKYKTSYLKPPLHEEVDWQLIQEAMKENDALILTSPANPTGHVAPFETLKKLSENAVTRNCFLIVDETYREFIWDNPPVNDEQYNGINFEKTVAIRSFSKTLSIPGWRVGFAITSPNNIERMATVHDSFYIGGSTIAQYALARSFSRTRDELMSYVSNLRETFLFNLDVLTRSFKAYGMEPLPVSATYYMLLKHDESSDMEAVKKLMKRGIVTTPLNILYSDSEKDTGYIRIHFAVSKETAEKVADILGG